MKRIEYTEITKGKLKDLKEKLTAEYGENVAKKAIKEILEKAKLLSHFEEMGVSLTNLYGVKTDYRYLYLRPNYLFYRIEEERIIIMNIFHEKEDFMRMLFPESSILQEEQFHYQP